MIKVTLEKNFVVHWILSYCTVWGSTVLFLATENIFLHKILALKRTLIKLVGKMFMGYRKSTTNANDFLPCNFNHLQYEVGRPSLN